MYINKRELNLEELKEIELKILLEIHDICMKNNFNYSLCGGTLLGAIRHKGFIPWDDDIDIVMPRDDYDKFIQYCINNTTKLRIVSHEVNRKYNYLFAKAYDPSTVIFDSLIDEKGIDLGVYVDIFPLDGLGNTFDGAKRLIHSIELYNYILVASHWKKYTFSKTNKFYIEPIRLLFYTLSKVCKLDKVIDKAENEMKKYNYYTSDYIGCACGSYRLKEIMKSEITNEYINVLFEGHEFKAFKNYDKYLRNIYGDYMKMPSSEQRVTHHTFKAYYR